MTTFITSEELATRIKFNRRYINEKLKDHCFHEGRHYVRPFGGRKILYIWENISQDIKHGTLFSDPTSIPMAKGGRCHG